MTLKGYTISFKIKEEDKRTITKYYNKILEEEKKKKTKERRNKQDGEYFIISSR